MIDQLKKSAVQADDIQKIESVGPGYRVTLCDKVPATLDRRRQTGDVIRRHRIGHDEIPVPLETRRLGRCELMLKPGLPHASPYHASGVPDLR